MYEGKKILRQQYKDGDCGPAMMLDTMSYLGIPPKHTVPEVRQLVAPNKPIEK
jgi:hypothetical protein